MRIRYHGFPWVRSKAGSELQKFFSDYGTLKHIPKGTPVFKGNEFYPNLSLVLSGLLAKFSEGFTFKETSKVKAISLLLPGTVLGGTFFLSNRLSNIASTALRDTVLLDVKHEAVWEYVRTHHNFGKALVNHIMLDLESDLEGMATIIARPPEERLAVLFKILVLRYEVQNENGWFNIPVKLTHSELSQVIYTIPLTLNRILLEWKKRGLYRKEGTERYAHKSLFDNLYDWEENRMKNNDVGSGA
jgi:CRP-like cAMP-binding protein